MSNLWSGNHATSQHPSDRPTCRTSHLSVNSMVTNASGLAESTISQGTAWTTESGDMGIRISQFPAPPSEVPTPTTPTRSGFRTPTSPHSTLAFSTRSAPTSLKSAFRSPHDSPVSPRSPAESSFRYSAGPSTFGGQTTVSRTTTLTAATSIHPTAPLKLHKRSSYVSHTPTVSPITPDDIPPLPPLPPNAQYDHPLPKRPPSPATLAASSMYDWTDGMSSVSVNTGEERMLSTSFITSLLAQTPDPFARSERPPNVWDKYARQHRLDDRPPESESVPGYTETLPLHALPLKNGIGYSEEPAAASRGHSPHQSVPQSVFSSDLFSPPAQASSFPTAEVPRGPRVNIEGDSMISGSHRNSADYSETLHSEEQVHALVRSPSLILANSGNARAVGLANAYRMSSAEAETSRPPESEGNSVITSSTIAPAQPPHRTDASLAVLGHPKFFDSNSDAIPRESEEDFAKSNSMSLDRFDLGQSSDLPHSPALPSTAGTQSRFTDEQTNRQRPGRNLSRNQSMRSVVSSVVSRISNASSGRRARYMAWLKRRPLPPLPPMPRNLPIDPYAAEIQKYEEDIPLPTLAKRAAALGNMLDGGHLPTVTHRPNSSFYKEQQSDSRVLDYSAQDRYAEVGYGRQSSRYSRGRPETKRRRSWIGGALTTLTSATSLAGLTKRSRGRIIVVACLVVGLVLAIAVPIGLSRQKDSPEPRKSCSGNSTGFSCTLDATCVCTSRTSGGSCKPLAKSLVDLIPTVNFFFDGNFTSSSMSDALFNAQGSPAGNNCSSQAVLVDVAPGVDGTDFPNRTLWAQSVILWNLGMSQDINATSVLQNFVANQAPWSSLDDKDGVVPDSSGRFSVVASGMTFDFASQTISPVLTTFKDSAGPTSAQLAELTASSVQILDRMYSFAQASSLQRQKTLRNYWRSTLQQQPGDLSKFVAAILNSPFLLPFDATSSPGGTRLTSLMTNSTSTSFPPPLACYPSLSSAQSSRLNNLETTVFGLSSAANISRFDPSCFPNRPVYGVLDVLRLRLPFTDDRKGAAKQAVQLSDDAQKRAVIYSGEIVSAFPGAATVPDVTVRSSDPRQFGTSNNFNHALLNFLTSIADVSLAMEFVQFVLNGSSTPPSNSSPRLFSSLSSFPVLEFAVFGSITPPDLSSSVSSFSTPNGSLFFGSDAGQAFRSWALVEQSSFVAWTLNATSSTIVNEGSSRNNNFESIWNPASQLVHAGPTNASDVTKVTQSLQSFGLFTSS